MCQWEIALSLDEPIDGRKLLMLANANYVSVVLAFTKHLYNNQK